MSSTETQDIVQTPRLQNVLERAQQVSARFNHNYSGVEHAVLALMEIETGVAVSVMQKLGIDIEEVKSLIKAELPLLPGTTQVTAGITSLPLTPRLMTVLAATTDEARKMKHSAAGTEHFLLAVLKEKEGTTAAVFAKMGLDLEDLEIAVKLELGGPAAGAPIRMPRAHHAATFLLCDARRFETEVSQMMEAAQVALIRSLARIQNSQINGYTNKLARAIVSAYCRFDPEKYTRSELAASLVNVAGAKQAENVIIELKCEMDGGDPLREHLETLLFFVRKRGEESKAPATA